MTDGSEVATVSVVSGWAGGSMHAELDLARGTMNRAGTQYPDAIYVIPPEALKTLRATARRAHTRGDQSVRQQFANGGESFAITVDGTTVTHTFETDGGNWCAGLQPIWDFVRKPHDRLDSITPRVKSKG